MWRCKQVSEALFHHHYWELPLHKRIGMRTHIALCIFCGRFQRQVMAMQDFARRFKDLEEKDQVGEDLHLSSAARERMAKALQTPPPD